MTMPAGPKRAWILGAGFSRSLGGPLMTDLLSLAAYRRALNLYPTQIRKDEADLVFWLYHYGAQFPEGWFHRDADIRGEARWRDAEEFLEVLDSAQTDPAKRGLVVEAFDGLRNALPYNLQHLARQYPAVFDGRPLVTAELLASVATRMVAASCCSFLEGIDKAKARTMERWLPYQQWLGLLRANDSILTFNYDRVVELLEPYVGSRQQGHRSAWGVCVHGVIPDRDDLDEARHAELPVLYKLHGSVNWTVEPNGVKERDWAPQCLGPNCRLAIATPGDNKMRMADGAFRKLWGAATDTIQEAEEVFIIGFRFPPSDAFPRDRLLDALRKNQHKELRVNVVLGPDQNADLKRVMALLGWTINARSEFDMREQAGHRTLVAHSLWAEDFLSVWAGNEQRRSGLPMPRVEF